MVQPKNSGYVIVDTANIFYQVFGENKQTVILIHGNGEDWHVFDKQIEPLVKHFKVVTIDSRGHGRSSFGREALTIEVMADDIIAVMDELTLTKAIIIGFSDGGNIAIQTALKYPKRIDKLIIAGANLNPTGVKWSSQLPIILSYFICLLTSFISNRARKRVQILDLMVNQPNFTQEELSLLTMPTLVLAGENDMIKQEHTELIAVSIPYSKLEILPKADHFIFSKEANKVTAMIITYILEK